MTNVASRRDGRWPHAVRTRLRDDTGSTLPLIFVCFAFAAGLVIVAAAATSLHLERLRLLTVADGAALAGAESFALDDVHVVDGRVTPTLTSGAVSAAVQDALAGAETSRLDQLRLVQASTPDARTASVTLSSVWHPPIVGPLLPLSLPVTVTSTARADFR